MGRNRKFVLEDDLQQAVWRTILREPRPPSVKPNQPKPEPQKKTPKVPSKPPPPRRDAVSPDVALAAARQRVVKLQAVLTTLGEEDETYPTLLAALKKAQAQAQERPVSERIGSTKSYTSRAQNRVEQASEDAVKAKEALADAIASQEKEEGLLMEGERRLEALLAEERTTPSPFCTASTSSICCNGRGKPVAGHRRQFATGDCAVERCAHSFHSDGRPRRRRSGSPTQEVEGRPLLAITGGHAAETFPAITGGHGQGFHPLQFHPKTVSSKFSPQTLKP